MSMLKVPVSSADHVQGPDGAVVTLLEYGDYECPFCKMAYPVVKRLQKHFGARLRFVFRNFPLRELHPHAQAAAETAEFAAVHGKFWEMHDLLYENQERLGDALLFELAEDLKLPAEELTQALESGRFTARVRADFGSGVRSGVNGTPTFFINGLRHDGPKEFPELLAAVEEAAEWAQNAATD